MKTLAIFLCLLCSPAFAQQSWWNAVAAQQAPVAAGGCTVASGDIFNESFESGQGSWSNLAGTPNYAAALPGTSPCSGLGTKCFEANYAGGAAAKLHGQYDLGSANNSTLYIRFYLYIKSSSLGTTDNNSLFGVSEGVDPIGSGCFRFNLRNSGTSLDLTVESSSGSAITSISVTTWYRCEVKYVPNSTGGSVFKIFNAAGSQIGSDATFNTFNSGTRYVNAGLITSDNTAAFDYVIDGIGISSTGYLGQ